MDDLISRQEAIYAVNTALFPKINTAKDAEKALRNLPPAQPEKRTQERTETHACDLIERQAAIDAIKNVDVVVLYYDGEPIDEAIEKAIEAVKRSVMASVENLPSAQPEIIRCKECKHYMPYEWMWDDISRSSDINDYSPDEIGCERIDHHCPPDGFCCFAERRTDESD